MRFDKFTLKAQEAVQEAQHLAEQRNHQQIEVSHLLAALLEQEEGIVSPIFKKLGVELSMVRSGLEKDLEKIPRVSGAGESGAYLAPALKEVGQSGTIGGHHTYFLISPRGGVMLWSWRDWRGL